MRIARLSSVIIIACLAIWFGYVASVAHDGIDERRNLRRVMPVYWDCDPVPDDQVLRRAFINRLMINQLSQATSGNRVVWYWSLYPYVALRISGEELKDDFLKTRTYREGGCTPFEDQTL